MAEPVQAAPPARDPLSQPVVTPEVRLGRTRRGGIALGRIRLSGDQRLARGLLELLRIEVPRGVRRGLVRSEPDAAPESLETSWIDVLT